jgi:hypothetical protein
LEIDGMEVSEDVDEVKRRVGACRAVQCRYFLRRIEDDAIDEAGDGERRAVDGDIGADGERRRHGHGCAGERSDDAVLARDVVGGGGSAER